MLKKAIKLWLQLTWIGPLAGIFWLADILLREYDAKLGRYGGILLLCYGLLCTLTWIKKTYKILSE